LGKRGQTVTDLINPAAQALADSVEIVTERKPTFAM